MAHVTFFEALDALFVWLEDIMCAHAHVVCEEGEHMLTVRLPGKKTYVINTHYSQQQVWIASPFSGGHHFVWRPHNGTLAGDSQDICFQRCESDKRHLSDFTSKRATSEDGYVLRDAEEVRDWRCTRTGQTLGQFLLQEQQSIHGTAMMCSDTLG